MATLWLRKTEMSAVTETCFVTCPPVRTSNRYTREFCLWSKPRYRISKSCPFPGDRGSPQSMSIDPLPDQIPLRFRLLRYTDPTHC